jgi:hypothetical protein
MNPCEGMGIFTIRGATMQNQADEVLIDHQDTYSLANTPVIPVGLYDVITANRGALSQSELEKFYPNRRDLADATWVKGSHEDILSAASLIKGGSGIGSVKISFQGGEVMGIDVAIKRKPVAVIEQMDSGSESGLRACMDTG